MLDVQPCAGRFILTQSLNLFGNAALDLTVSAAFLSANRHAAAACFLFAFCGS